MTNGIELRQLRHFMALAEELHFGRAARRCNISQPPFSVSIQKLEAELGVRLFERTSHAVNLTPAGAAFYAEVGRSLAQLGHAADVARRVNEGIQGVIKVGFFTSMLFRGLEKAIVEFGKTCPLVELRLVELNTTEQMQAVLRREIHYGFVHSEVAGEDLVLSELLREPLMLCLPRSHPRARDAKVDLSMLRGEPFIIFAREKSPTFYDQVVALCVQSGFNPKIRYEARNWLTVIACVSKGMGITLAPKSLASTGLPGVAFVDIGAGHIKSVVSSVWHRADDGNPVIRKWHQTVRNAMRLDATGAGSRRPSKK